MKTSDTATPPLCINCRHHTLADHCKRKRPMVNTVTGAEFYPLCETERKASFRDRFLTSMNRCGAQGRFFEARSGGVAFHWETPDYFDA